MCETTVNQPIHLIHKFYLIHWMFCLNCSLMDSQRSLLNNIISPETTTHFQSLTLSWQRSLSYQNQSIDFLCKSVDWFLDNRDLRHERFNKSLLKSKILFLFHYKCKHFKAVIKNCPDLSKYEILDFSRFPEEFYKKRFLHFLSALNLKPNN